MKSVVNQGQQAFTLQRSSKAGETHLVPPAAYVSSQQLQEKAANRRRQNAKKTGGEIFVLYLL